MTWPGGNLVPCHRGNAAAVPNLRPMEAFLLGVSSCENQASEIPGKESEISKEIKFRPLNPGLVIVLHSPPRMAAFLPTGSFIIHTPCVGPSLTRAAPTLFRLFPRKFQVSKSDPTL